MTRTPIVTYGTLDAPFAPRDLSVMAALGDSLTEQGGGIPANSSYRAVSPWTWGNSLLGHRLRVINAGKAGQTSAQILARVQTDVVDAAPGWCHVLCGTNDVAQAVAQATIKANITAILDALDAAGIRTVIGTIPPRNSYTGTMRADLDTLNDWIRSLALTRRGLIVVDYYAALADPATGNYLTGYANADGIHLSERGGAACGRLFADALRNRVPTVRRLSHAAGDTKNLLTGGRFAGTGSAVPTGWSLQGFAGGAPVISRVPRTDGVAGSWLQLVVPVGSTGYLQGPNITVASGAYAVGDSLQFAVEYEVTGLDSTATAGGSQALTATLQSYDGSSFTTKISDLYSDGATLPFGATDRSGVLETPALVAPAGGVLVQEVILLYGGGTYRLDCPTLRKV